METKKEIGQLFAKVGRRYAGVANSSIPSCCLALLDQVSSKMPGPPALWSSGGGNSGIEPFGTGGDTHTHTPYGTMQIIPNLWIPQTHPKPVLS